MSGPVFMCGPSRSGTAMLRSALNRHPDVHLTGETHYFDDLRVRLAESLDRPLHDPEATVAAEYFAALSHRPYGHGGDPHRGRITPAEIRARAEALGGRLDHYLEAYCRIEAEREGKAMWGEKTPRHIFRIGEIFELHPDARVVCMSRDPRAVVASYRDWRNRGGFDFEKDPEHRQTLEEEERRVRRSYHPAIITMLWRAQTRAALAAGDAFGPDRVYLQRYEDLAREPEETLPALCRWLGLRFHDSMLEVPMHNSSYSNFERDRGITTEAVDRWRTKLHGREIRVVERIARRQMRALGYEPESNTTSALLGEAALWLTLPVTVVRATLANRERMGNIPAYFLRRARLAFGG